ncbi:hypothetical protein HHI36_018254 [Cryptolaemus montrouzieri]|uniref:Uncharacterized protein n=1 Tax=Cryptolaemus montrouzieri TaxID=559131 RepID=A0ABD2NZH3_9CUCU
MNFTPLIFNFCREFDEFNFALIEPDPPSVSSSVNIESTEGIPDVTTVSDTPENQETLGALPFISCVESVAESSSYEPVKKKRKKNDKMLQLSRNDHFDLIEYVAEITSKSRREVATYCLENGIDVYKKPPEMQLTAMINHFIYGEGQDSADECK